MACVLLLSAGNALDTRACSRELDNIGIEAIRTMMLDGGRKARFTSRVCIRVKVIPSWLREKEKHALENAPATVVLMPRRKRVSVPCSAGAVLVVPSLLPRLCASHSRCALCFLQSRPHCYRTAASAHQRYDMPKPVSYTLANIFPLRHRQQSNSARVLHHSNPLCDLF